MFESQAPLEAVCDSTLRCEVGSGLVDGNRTRYYSYACEGWDGIVESGHSQARSPGSWLERRQTVTTTTAFVAMHVLNLYIECSYCRVQPQVDPVLSLVTHVAREQQPR